MPRRYPPEFRSRVLALLDAGRSVTEVAAELGVSGQTIYNWRNQQQVDSGLWPGITSTEQAELVAARRRIAQLGLSSRLPDAEWSCCGRRCPQKAFRGRRGDREGGPVG